MGMEKADSNGVVTDPTLAQRNELGVIIFIRNIPIATDEEQLYSLFADYGTVRKVSSSAGTGRRCIINPRTGVR